MFCLCSCQCLSREAQGHELSNCKVCAMQRWYVVSFAFSQCQEEEVVLVPAVYSGPTEHQDTLVSTDIILNNPIVMIPTLQVYTASWDSDKAGVWTCKEEGVVKGKTTPFPVLFGKFTLGE